MRTQRDEGFTLIELLTVCVLISVLATVAVSALMAQRAKAYRTAMLSDLRSIVTSEAAFSTDNDAYTSDLTALATQGYRRTKDVTAHVKVTGDAFVACTMHPGVGEWLVFDSTTATTASSPADCL